MITVTTETTTATAAADPLRRLSEEGVATFRVAWQDLLDDVAKSMNGKGVDGE